MQEAVEHALVWRAKAISLYGQLEKKEHLSSADLEALYEGAENYLVLRERLFSHAKRYESFAEEETEPNLDTIEGALVMKKIKLSLAAALVLYDNYMIGIYPYYANTKYRRLLRRDHPKLEGVVSDLTQNYLDPSNRKKAAYAIALAIQEKSRSYRPLDTEAAYLDALIEQSASFKYLQENNPYETGSILLSILRKISDDLNYLGRIFTYMTSKIFGNSVGLVETRKGYLLSLPEEEKNGIVATMEPLDVLLEKTPFRLTDKFIPGHYGHVAIWVGNEEQLKALGVWEDPAVIPYHEQIRSGHSVVEALRPGVEINTFEQFLNIDDLLVLRHTGLSLEKRREYVIRAFRQIGKEYDFNFDIETDKRIICSEIAYVVFKDEDWPTSKTLGRYTISPDNVAVKGFKNPFVPLVLYHDGRKVENRLEESLKALLDEDYERFREMHGFEMRAEE